MVREHAVRRLILVAILLAGCTASKTTQTLHPSASPSIEGGECDHQAEVTGKVDDRTNSTDVDGDGTKDPINIIIDGQGQAGCRAYLSASIDGDIVSEPIWQQGRQGGLPAPSFAGLAQIGGGGMEIVVNELAGASTQFVGLFTYVDGALERIRPKAGTDLWTGAADGVFPFGGSVGHLDAVDCSDDGHVVVSEAIPAGSSADAYEVQRRFFTLDGSTLVEDKDLAEKATVDGLKLDDYPEFASSPFGSCN
jgi:hypothetical protein